MRTGTEALADIPKEGEEDALKKIVEAETPPESQTEKETTDETPTVEATEEVAPEAAPQPQEEIPSARESYRWKRMRQELDERKGREEEYAKRIAELETKINSNTQDTAQVPPDFAELFGDNPKLYQAFSELTKAQAKEIVDARLAEVNAQAQKEANAESELQASIQSGFEDLGDELGVDLSDPKNSDRNAILKVAIDYYPTSDGVHVDLKKAHELWLKLNPKVESTVNAERKKIADIATPSSPRAELEKPTVFGQSRNMDLSKFLE